jgi:hypothetical protein
MTKKKLVEHSEKVKKVRRKIEDKIRMEFTEEKVQALATLLDIKSTIPKVLKND